MIPGRPYYSSLKIHMASLRCGAVIKVLISEMRRTADRSDLTLQGGPNQHGTYLPRRTIQTNHSPLRLELQDRPTIIWSAELNMRPPKVIICNPISPRLLD